MRAQDFRIGNKIMFSNDSSIFEVTGIYEFGLDVKNDIEETYIEHDQFEPIPITEEWLLKFEKINWISKDVGGIFYWFNGEKKHLKFVHSLQNTYFCIEQKELLCVNI